MSSTSLWYYIFGVDRSGGNLDEDIEIKYKDRHIYWIIFQNQKYAVDRKFQKQFCDMLVMSF